MEIRSILAVPSSLDKYNNCHLLLNPSPTQNDEFSYTKVQDVVTSTSAKEKALEDESFWAVESAIAPVKVFVQIMNGLILLGALVFDDVADGDDSDKAVFFDDRQVSDAFLAHDRTALGLRCI